MKKKDNIKTIEFDLIENGLDFIISSLKSIVESKDEIQLKYSVLHLSSGIELILKERLRREHWTLIFSNIKAANLQSLKSGDFHSVNFYDMIERLENVCGIAFLDFELNYLKELKKRRNRIEHFEFKEKEKAIKSLTSKVLSIIVSFINEHFDKDSLTNHSNEQLTYLRKKIADFDEFTEFRLAQINSELEIKKQETEVVTCSMCFQKAFVLNEELNCLFCGYSDDADNAALNYIENVLGISSYLEYKDGGYFPLETCFECENDSLVNDNGNFICFNCSYTWEESDVLTCSNCGELFLRQQDTFIDNCDSCLTYRIEKFG